MMSGNGVVIRTVYPRAPVHIEYRLSDLGTSLLEPLAALRHWAIDHLDDVVLARKAHDVSDEDAAGP
jgi:DNA-binding HxlR family transcriptional regulator